MGLFKTATPAPKATDRGTYQGRSVDLLTRQILDVANALLRLPKFGSEIEPATIVQGSWSRNVGASAGTHDGGAAVDMTAFNWRNRVKVYRLLGVAYFDRPTIWRLWSHHGHGIVCGMGNAAPLAQAQVRDYYNGRNGLANNGKDKDWRPRVFPLAVFNGHTGRALARVACHAYEQPTALSKPERDVHAGARVKVLMEVNVGGRRWSVTDRGDFIDSANLATS